MTRSLCSVVRIIAPGSTRPCFLDANHGQQEHLFIYQGQIVNERGEVRGSLGNSRTVNLTVSPESATTDAG